jgi:hypothetical protein
LSSPCENSRDQSEEKAMPIGENVREQKGDAGCLEGDRLEHAPFRPTTMSSYGPASEDGDDDRPSRFSHDYDNSAIHPIPRRTLLAIEYPGYIDRSTADSSARSLQRAISTLGGPRHLQSYLVSSPSTPNLELNYGRLSEDGREHVVPSRWKHPIPASAAQGDKLVVRVRKRTKVRVWRDSSGVERRDRIDAGEFTVDMVGCVAKTLRFRCSSQLLALAVRASEGSCS